MTLGTSRPQCDSSDPSDPSDPNTVIPSTTLLFVRNSAFRKFLLYLHALHTLLHTVFQLITALPDLNKAEKRYVGYLVMTKYTKQATVRFVDRHHRSLDAKSYRYRQLMIEFKTETTRDAASNL